MSLMLKLNMLLRNYRRHSLRSNHYQNSMGSLIVCSKNTRDYGFERGASRTIAKNGEHYDVNGKRSGEVTCRGGQCRKQSLCTKCVWSSFRKPRSLHSTLSSPPSLLPPPPLLLPSPPPPSLPPPPPPPPPSTPPPSTPGIAAQVDDGYNGNPIQTGGGTSGDAQNVYVRGGITALAGSARSSNGGGVVGAGGTAVRSGCER
ncbi:hypothetical protein C5167_012847 [Papaver somniferum]|uniref:Uncharacterized protein n=1 Tax=Papaver somniferum TaxID=3469 RepID=A0A4Y7J1R3_PAPSO|nr:hypothetical protein C5167_012847 [Papaver somniferum]